MNSNLGLIGFFKPALFVICFTGLCFGANAAPTTVEETYKSYCETCHGGKLTGGLGPSLIDSTWLHGKSVSNAFSIIKNGVSKAGMPAFGKTLTDGQIYSLIGYVREQAAAAKEISPNWKRVEEKSSPSSYNEAGHKFELKPVASIQGEVWSMAFLPSGSILASIKSGGLFVIDGAKPIKVEHGLPKTMNKGQGGFFDVKLDPNYAKNQFVYLSYSEASAQGSMTRVDRGIIKRSKEGLEWVHSKTVFSAPAQFHISTHHHFGGRLAFSGGKMFVSVGDRGRRPMAQDISVPNGKIHRVNMEGVAPQDNPFIKTSQAFSTIWSYGHRNPQGMAVHPLTGDLWAAEHGPRGGDEINLIQKAQNYGWPVITYGMNYNGTPMTDKTHEDGMLQPKHYWVPSIAVSGIAFYTGSHFPKWKNQLLVASLGKQELRLLTIKESEVTSDTLLFKGIGRMRDVVDGPDGYPYVSVLSKQGEWTTIYRME